MLTDAWQGKELAQRSAHPEFLFDTAWVEAQLLGRNQANLAALFGQQG